MVNFNYNKQLINMEKTTTTTQPQNLKAMVIGVGVINMTNGNTAYSWSIYENTGMYAYLSGGGTLLLGAKDTFNIGDNVTLIGNDSNRSLGKCVTIVDFAEATKEALLPMLKSHQYDYYPIRAFKARPKGNRKLSTSYSVKGVLNNTK